MKEIKITKVIKREVPQRKKYQHHSSYNALVKSIEEYDKDMENMIGRTIRIKRMNQALTMYYFAGAGSPKAAPKFYVSHVTKDGEIYFVADYSNTDIYEII